MKTGGGPRLLVQPAVQLPPEWPALSFTPTSSPPRSGRARPRGLLARSHSDSSRARRPCGAAEPRGPAAGSHAGAKLCRPSGVVQLIACSWQPPVTVSTQKGFGCQNLSLRTQERATCTPRLSFPLRSAFAPLRFSAPLRAIASAPLRRPAPRRPGKQDDQRLHNAAPKFWVVNHRPAPLPPAGPPAPPPPPGR